MVACPYFYETAPALSDADDDCVIDPTFAYIAMAVAMVTMVAGFVTYLARQERRRRMQAEKQLGTRLLSHFRVSDKGPRYR